MKKVRTRKYKIVRFYIIITIILFIVAFLGLWFGYTDSNLSKPLKSDTYKNWMSEVKDSTKLTELVIPGSHDAGTNKMMPQAMTQGHSFYDQLNGGVRYFDTRVTNKKDKLVIFHGPIKGELFSNIIADINKFIIEEPSEFIIIDFQHLGPSHEPIIKMIKDKLDLNKMLRPSLFPHISDVTLKDIRANSLNFMIIWNDSTEASANDFYYRDTTLRSEYNGKIHKKSNEALIKEFSNYYANKEKDKLFVLQAQRTAKTLLGKPSIYEKSFKPVVNKYIENLKNNQELLAKTNIIMRDFIVSDLKNIELILSLNQAKNLYK